MRSNASQLAASLVGIVVLGTRAALAQCAIDFEDYPVGTVLTTEYLGVTFSVAAAGGCTPNASTAVRVAAPGAGTSSATRAAAVDNGGDVECGFNPLKLRMDFSPFPERVSFTLGDTPGSYRIRALRPNLSVVYDQTISVSSSGVFRAVTIDVSSAFSLIGRIEIEHLNQGQEMIDDLVIWDDTPPEIEIIAPTGMQCVCGEVQVVGTTCDPDGRYAFDRLEYLRIDPPSGSDWTLINQFSTPVCDLPGVLYTWDTSPADLTEGIYVLRLTAMNMCGLTSSELVAVYLEKDFDTVDVRRPIAGRAYGNTVCISGTVFDQKCFDRYRVDYRATGSGAAFQPVDPATPVYNTYVINDPFGHWDTLAAGVPDGSYDIRVRGFTECGNTRTVIVTIDVDNTPAAAEIDSPAMCERVEGVIPIVGTAYDDHFDRYELQYIGGTARTWVTFAEGDVPIVNGLLGELDTQQLPECEYAIRLLVHTTVDIGHCDDDLQRSEDHVIVSTVQCARRLDRRP